MSERRITDPEASSAMEIATDRTAARPWRVSGRYLASEHNGYVRIASPFQPDAWGAEKDANAALIVRAVNNHDALMEALEAVLCAKFIEEQIQLGHAERHDHTMTMDDALDQARAALDAAKS